jgi:hypothetical protein
MGYRGSLVVIGNDGKKHTNNKQGVHPMSGPEALAALRAATRHLTHGSIVRINQQDADFLRTLLPSELRAAEWDDATTQAVSAALLNGDFDPLGTALGIRLVVDPKAPAMLNRPPRAL